jgi:hypothetical protein
MRRSRKHLSREAAEHLLDGRVGGSIPLARLLSAARAAPHGRELDGEDAAAAAFRNAYRTPAPAPVAARVGAKRTTARLLAAAGAIVVAGGVGVAAATGALPGTGAHTGRPSVSRPVVPTATVPDADRQRSAGPGPTGTVGSAGAVPRPGDTAGLLGLCRAYLAMAPRAAERALETPAFARLAARKPDVAAYCTALLATAAGASATPSEAADPGATRPKPTPEPPRPTPSRTPKPGSVGG